MRTFTADQIATACADAGITGSKCESLVIALHCKPPNLALAVERASKMLLVYETHLWEKEATENPQPLRNRVAAMIEAMKEMGV